MAAIEAYFVVKDSGGHKLGLCLFRWSAISR